MPTSAEEAREEIEGVLVGAATALALLVLFQSFMSVLVVDLACLGFAQCFVCFGHLDESLVYRVVAPAARENVSVFSS